MRSTALFMLALAVMAPLHRSAAQEGPSPGSGAALAVKVGTLGPGAELTVAIAEDLNLRGGVAYLDIDSDGTFDDADYDLDVQLLSGIALIDWHVFGNHFRVSGGAVWSDHDITLNAMPNEPQTIGDTTYPAAALGTLTGTLAFEEFAPYVGIGFGNAVGVEGRLSFSFDLGVIFQSYEVTLSADGPATALPGFESDLRREEQNIEDDMNDVGVYPLVAIGMGYRF